MTCVEEVCSGRPLNIIRDLLTCARSVMLGRHMFKTALNYPSFVDLCTFCDVEEACSVTLRMHMFKTDLNYPNFAKLCTFCDVSGAFSRQPLKY